MRKDGDDEVEFENDCDIIWSEEDILMSARQIEKAFQILEDNVIKGEETDATDSFIEDDVDANVKTMLLEDIKL